jgi:hypothetical protein
MFQRANRRSELLSLFVGLYRFSLTVPDALKILKPETIARWQRRLSGRNGA